MNKKCINILFVLMMCFSLAGNAFAASKVLLLPFAVNAQGKNTVQASLDELFTNSLRKSGLQVVKEIYRSVMSLQPVPQQETQVRIMPFTAHITKLVKVLIWICVL